MRKVAQFRRKRSDTRIKNIELSYKVELNVRADMKLGTLLKKRGFNSLSALLSAYKGKRSISSDKRKIFLSFFHPHGKKKGWVSRITSELGYSVIRSNRINSENAEYIKKELHKRISECSVLVCLIGYGSHNRKWVRWEMEEAIKQGKGLCGIRLPNSKDSRGRNARKAKAPPLLEHLNCPIVDYPKPADRKTVICAIEQAAAIGSAFKKKEVDRAH